MINASRIKIPTNLVCASFLVFSLSACATPSSINQPTTKTFSPAEFDTKRTTVSYNPALPEKTFRNGDIATITVNGFDEFSGIYTVGNDGNIFLGHIGNIYVAGKTVPEVQSNLTKQYNECCLVNPNVSIEREGQAFGKIVVDGAVNDAGVFDVENVIKLSEAIALAGGISETANAEMTILSREINGERKVSNVNLADIQQFGGNDPLIYPSDVVFVQDSKGKVFYKDFVKTVPIISALILASTR